MSKITAREVLDAVRGSGTGNTDFYYRLGYLAAWLARLANKDITIRQELRALQERGPVRTGRKV